MPQQYCRRVVARASNAACYYYVSARRALFLARADPSIPAVCAGSDEEANWAARWRGLALPAAAAAAWLKWATWERRQRERLPASEAYTYTAPHRQRLRCRRGDESPNNYKYYYTTIICAQQGKTVLSTGTAAMLLYTCLAHVKILYLLARDSCEKFSFSLLRFMRASTDKTLIVYFI